MADRESLFDHVPSAHWFKLPIIGMPGTECGRRLLDDGGTEVVQDFKDEFGPCEEPSRWLVGGLMVCQKHAAMIAYDFGDDIDEIETAWKAQF